jgi:hypothetical protein
LFYEKELRRDEDMGLHETCFSLARDSGEAIRERKGGKGGLRGVG